MWALIVSVPDHCLSFYFKHPTIFTDRSKVVLFVAIGIVLCIVFCFVQASTMTTSVQ